MKYKFLRCLTGIRDKKHIYVMIDGDIYFLTSHLMVSRTVRHPREFRDFVMPDIIEMYNDQPHERLMNKLYLFHLAGDNIEHELEKLLSGKTNG